MHISCYRVSRRRAATANPETTRLSQALPLMSGQFEVVKNNTRLVIHIQTCFYARPLVYLLKTTFIGYFYWIQNLFMFTQIGRSELLINLVKFPFSSPPDLKKRPMIYHLGILIKLKNRFRALKMYIV